ncbi:LysR family transcriptional regulator [Ruegeria sp. 2012CJ41-6]|uniref:LysR family transcriptional regulator n=1 Tax=Ruegeria spongiae TaxID=2942209 RepID=A0ABT0Q2X6_9RHOB|nr:LysR family transcriptional regulator [Ruegeria spongiae]MCL6284190.1 LysR family transcriptional regulator [Ruegeria spongiae]
MRHNLNLNWLRSFEAAARLLSFTSASHEIGLTQTAVSQHIKALEAQLGEKLFERRPKSLQLTDVGQAYLLTVREALITIEMSTTGLFGPQEASTITVRASMALIMWLTPRLESFLRDHPDTSVKLITSIWKNPSDQHPVDVDIVLASKEYARSDLELLSDEAIVPIFRAAYDGGINGPKDLLLHPSIHILGFDDHWARYLAAFSLKPASLSARLVTDTSTAAIEMVAAGLGCAVIIERFALGAINAGQNIRIVGDAAALGQSHYLVRTEHHIVHRPQAEAFNSWLRQQF